MIKNNGINETTELDECKDDASASKRLLFEYRFDEALARSVGIVDGSGLSTGHVGTQNHRGFQMSTLNPLYNQWIEASKINKASYPIIDIGCAFGTNVLSASFKDHTKHVVGLDMTQSHLDYIIKAEDMYTKQGFKKDGVIETIEDSLPYLKSLKDETYSSILCAEVIHFLTGDELQIAFKRLHDILVKGGQLHLTCMSIEAGQGSIKPIVIERKRQDPNNKWPAYFTGEEFMRAMKQIYANWDEINEKSREEARNLSRAPMIHFLTASQVATLAEDAGFIVKSVVTNTHPGYPPSSSSQYSNIQLIAIKI